MKGCKIKKKDRRKPVHVAEVQMTKVKCVPPKKLITKVHSVPIPTKAVISLEVADSDLGSASVMSAVEPAA
jgi:hypothetical protein